MGSFLQVDVPCYNQAGADSGVHRHGLPDLLSVLTAHGFDDAVDIAGRFDGPHRVVFLGGRNAEESHDGIADILLHESTILLDDSAHAVYDLTHDLFHFFRIEFRRHGRIAGDVGKQYCDVLALALVRGGRHCCFFGFVEPLATAIAEFTVSQNYNSALRTCDF